MLDGDLVQIEQGSKPVKKRWGGRVRECVRGKNCVLLALHLPRR